MVAQVGLAGGGEPANTGQLRAAEAAGAPNARLSPSPSLGGLSPPIIRMEASSSVLGNPAVLPRPPPPPSSRGRAGKADAQSSGRGWGSGLRSPGPGAPAPRLPLLRPLLRLRGHRSLRKLRRGRPWLRSPAPRPAWSLSRIGARCAANGRPGLREPAGGGDAGAPPHPTCARVDSALSRRPLLVWKTAHSHA